MVGSGEVVPSVMLSPKARKRTDDSTGTAETITEKPHVPDRPRLSVAVQVTRVVPERERRSRCRARTSVVTGCAAARGDRRVERHHGWLSLSRRRLDVGRTRQRRRGTGGSGLVGESPQSWQAAPRARASAGGGTPHRAVSLSQHVWSRHRVPPAGQQPGPGVMSLQSSRFYTIASGVRRHGASRTPRAPRRLRPPCSCIALRDRVLRGARTPEVLRSVAALPPHLAGLFSEAAGFHQLRSGGYLVFDRRGHTVYGVDAAPDDRDEDRAGGPGIGPHHPAGRVCRVLGRPVRRGRRAGRPRARAAVRRRRARGSAASSCPGAWKRACSTAAWC